MSAHELRQNIVGFIHENPNIELEALDQPKELWIRNMMTDKYFCDFPFLCAAAHFLSRDICLLPVFVEDAWQNNLMVIESNRENKRPPLYVLYYSDDWFYNGHFQSIRPIEEEPEFDY